MSKLKPIEVEKLEQELKDLREEHKALYSDFVTVCKFNKMVTDEVMQLKSMLTARQRELFEKQRALKTAQAR